MVVHVNITEDQFLLIREGEQYSFDSGLNGDFYYKTEWNGLCYHAVMENGRVVDVQQVEPRAIPKEEVWE